LLLGKGASLFKKSTYKNYHAPPKLSNAYNAVTAVSTSAMLSKQVSVMKKLHYGKAKGGLIFWNGHLIAC